MTGQRYATLQERANRAAAQEGTPIKPDDITEAQTKLRSVLANGLPMVDQEAIEEAVELLGRVLATPESRDAARLDWLEQQHTLHHSVDMLYVVDGYDLQMMNDGNEGHCFHGETLRDAIDNAMRNAR